MSETIQGIWFEGTFMRVLVSSAQSGGRISVMEQWLPAGFSTPTHVHGREDQTIHVLEGEIHARVGGEPVTLQAGESVFLPRDVPHVLKAGENGAKMLEINTPGGFEQFHVEIGEPASQARMPPPKEPDVAALDAAIQRFGAKIVGPPLT